jgi:hypothetical protein
MKSPEIHFDKQELDFMDQTDFFHLKNTVSTKIQQLMGTTSDGIEEFMHSNQESFQLATWQKKKISKGENYKGLPYFVLDHPKYFTKNDILSFRTIFIYGQGFLNVMHLSGHFFEILRDNRQLISYFRKNEPFYIFTQEDPWNYDYREEYLISSHRLRESTLSKLKTNNGFIRLVRALETEKWSQLPEFTAKSLALFWGIFR